MPSSRDNVLTVKHAHAGTDGRAIDIFRAADAAGIPYFKHDFGYEFGVARPANTYGAGNATNDTTAVSFPVIHEFSATVRNNGVDADGGSNCYYDGRTSSAVQMSHELRRERFTTAAAAHATGEGFQYAHYYTALGDLLYHFFIFLGRGAQTPRESTRRSLNPSSCTLNLARRPSSRSFPIRALYRVSLSLDVPSKHLTKLSTNSVHPSVYILILLRCFYACAQVQFFCCTVIACAAYTAIASYPRYGDFVFNVFIN